MTGLAPAPGDGLPYPRAYRMTAARHPSYALSWYACDRGIRYVAVARRRDVHPVCVVAVSLAELDSALDPRDGQCAGLAQIYPLRPGDRMSGL